MTEYPQALSHQDYTVGWICALPETEFVAAMAMLDEKHPVLPSWVHDFNTYALGRIGDHNVVIACLPAETTGKGSAATVAKDMIRSFPNVRFGLMVGIGGGAPYYGAQGNEQFTSIDVGEGDSEDSGVDADDIRDIRLGDVVISLHSKSSDAVVQYDFGKSLQENRFIRCGGRLNKPPSIVLTAIAHLKALHESQRHKISKTLSEKLSDNPELARKFQHPGPKKDFLFKSNVDHDKQKDHDKKKRSCKACRASSENCVKRKDRTDKSPHLHYGTIGSADQVMRNAVLRDKWAQDESIICFEMEAAGQYYTALEEQLHRILPSSRTDGLIPVPCDSGYL